MENKYVLISYDGVTNWYLIIRDYDSDLIEFSSDILEDSMIQQAIDGRKGLTIDLIVKFKAQSIIQKGKWLSEGRILLVNEKGGTMFLEDNMKILEEKEFGYFPRYKCPYLTGWLSPTGEFTPCNYGKHRELAMNLVEDEVSDRDLYIPMGHCDDISCSHIGLSDKKPTEKQIEFFKKNVENFDDTQLSILKSNNII